MRRIEILAAVSGIVLAGFVLAATAIEAPQPEAPPRVAGELSRAAPATDEIVEVTIPLPAPVVADLPSAVAGVLAEHGHTDLVPQGALLDALPPNVVGVLMEHDAVLRIPETEDALP